ncbi:MAG: hypothetical protein LBC75_06790 [Fibromonadaceae bacterium]|jgi:uncharacterized protein (TIGR02145 family)|nr:hypothetical protein [Fibromonadaceae bacterium]
MKTQTLLNSIFVTAFIAMLLLVVPCDAASNPSALVGRWVGVSGDDKGVVMELLSDGTGITTRNSIGVTITWKTEKGRFYLIASGVAAQAASYKLQGSELTFNEDDGKINKYTKCNKNCQEATEKYYKAEAEKARVAEQKATEEYAKAEPLKAAAEKAWAAYKPAAESAAAAVAAAAKDGPIKAEAEKAAAVAAEKLAVIVAEAEKASAAVAKAEAVKDGTFKVAAEKANVLKAKVQRGSFIDPRDGRTYKTVKFDKQTWMAENLNYNASDSKCYENQEINCQKYGRLYNWETAKSACPSGWHLPNNNEWQALVDFAGGDKVAGIILKASNGWNWNGVDAVGFSALPGGYGYSDGGFSRVGYDGYWSSATGNDDASSCLSMGYAAVLDIFRNVKNRSAFSVRCVQD